MDYLRVQLPEVEYEGDGLKLGKHGFSCNDIDAPKQISKIRRRRQI